MNDKEKEIYFDIACLSELHVGTYIDNRVALPTVDYNIHKKIVEIHIKIPGIIDSLISADQTMVNIRNILKQRLEEISL